MNMGFLLVFISILQSLSTSLGVGASTLAIINFFVAIADGSIDETERRMMGVTYTVLRVAMLLILFTTAFQLLYEYYIAGGTTLATVSLAQIITLIVLFLNAILMTARVMPSTFGPSIQVASWYTLGTLAAFIALELTTFTLVQFLLGYFTATVLAIGVVNGIMAAIKAKKEASA